MKQHVYYQRLIHESKQPKSLQKTETKHVVYDEDYEVKRNKKEK